MMKNILIIMQILILITGCESFVENTAPSVSYVSDDDINDPSNIPFLITGVLNEYSYAHTYVSLWADGLSDELVNDGKVQGTTGARGEYIDNGFFDHTQGTYVRPYEAIALAWRSAHILKEKLDIMDGEEAAEAEGYYTAYLYQGLPCYLLGSYYGRGPNYPGDGGATLNGSAFIPSSELYEMALAYFDSALVFANDYQTKVVHSLIGRLHLYGGNYSVAAVHASQGLQDGDAPFEGLSGEEWPWPNWYWQRTGNFRTSWTLGSRFKYLLGEDFEDANGNGVWDSTETFIDCAVPGADVGQGDGVYNGPTEPEESVRLPMSAASMTPGVEYVRYFQTKYPDADSPISIINWQENHLILAELALRNEAVGVSALDAVNAVRASYGLFSLESIDFSVLLHERDKELFCQGQRLMDQNRFPDELPWHMLGTETWHYLSIPYEEELANPNYP